MSNFRYLVFCINYLSIWCSISMSVLRQLYRWSVEELRLASGAEGVTRLQHQLKLCSAYSGVPVCCIPKSTPTSIKSLKSNISATSLWLWYKDCPWNIDMGNSRIFSLDTQNSCDISHSPLIFINLIWLWLWLQGNHRTRDDIGEPLATSYHSKFMGTVDYIW